MEHLITDDDDDDIGPPISCMICDAIFAAIMTFAIVGGISAFILWVAS